MLRRTLSDLASDSRTGLKQAVTAQTLQHQSVDRWYYFPHSFSSELVYSVASAWELTEDDQIVDPFVGSGTTLVAAQRMGIPSRGYDLSPFAVLISSAKTHQYDVQELEKSWCLLKRALGTKGPSAVTTTPSLLRKALDAEILDRLRAARLVIDEFPRDVRDFFLAAIASVLPAFSLFQKKGGWGTWGCDRLPPKDFSPSLSKAINGMIEDLKSDDRACWDCEVQLADARKLPAKDESFTAGVTSPPYPNRHDYTRIFCLELLALLQSEAELQALRRQTLHSHPEAKPKRPTTIGYVAPSGLVEQIAKLRNEATDLRVPAMLEGYFLDMFLVLGELHRVIKKGGTVAIVVGNVRYCGKMIPVDSYIEEIAAQVGLTCCEKHIARRRGNSAQQMAEYGREPARETVLLLQREA